MLLWWVKGPKNVPECKFRRWFIFRLLHTRTHTFIVFTWFRIILVKRQSCVPAGHHHIGFINTVVLENVRHSHNYVCQVFSPLLKSLGATEDPGITGVKMWGRDLGDSFHMLQDFMTALISKVSKEASHGYRTWRSKGIITGWKRFNGKDLKVRAFLLKELNGFAIHLNHHPFEPSPTAHLCASAFIVYVDGTVLYCRTTCYVMLQCLV